jgi:hypothetical protein
VKASVYCGGGTGGSLRMAEALARQASRRRMASQCRDLGAQSQHVLEIEISNNSYIDRIILSIDRSLIFYCNLYDKYISFVILIRVYI